MDRRAFLRLTGAVLATAAFPPVVRKALAIPASSRHRHDQGRRARRDPDAGEPLVRPLLRHARAACAASATASRSRCPSGAVGVGAAAERRGRRCCPTTSTAPPATRSASTARRHVWADAHDGLGQRPHGRSGRQQGRTGRWATTRARTCRSSSRSPTPSRSATPTTARSTARTNPNRLFLLTGTNDPTGARRRPGHHERDDSIGPPTRATPGRPTRAARGRRASAGRSTRTSPTTSATTRWPASGNTATPYVPEQTSPLAARRAIGDRRSPGPTDGRRFAQRRARGHACPQVSWIVAPAAYSEHPGPSSPVQGAWYTQQVLEALTADPDVWSKTVLLVNFDENDGFFDHVPPPCAPSLDR